MKAKLRIPEDSLYGPDDPLTLQNVEFAGGPPVVKNSHFWTWPVGTIISHPDVWRKVRAGAAIPVDDECKEKVAMSTSQINEAMAAHDRLLNAGSVMSAAEQKESLEKAGRL